MWKTALKLAIQYLIARFIRNSMQNVPDQPSGNHLSGFTSSVAALLESHATLFKNQFNHDIHRIVNSLLGFMFILFAAIFSGLAGLMWIFAAAWNSANRDIILGTTMILPLILGVGVYFAIRLSWKKQPLLQKSMVQIEQDWQVFKNGLDGTADTSDEANR